MLKIDTHAHYLPRDWPDLAAKYGVSPNTIKKTLLELDGDVGVYAIHGRGFFLQLPGEYPVRPVHAHGFLAEWTA